VLVPELQRKESGEGNTPERHLEHVLLALERGFPGYVAIGCAGHFLDGSGELYKVDNNLVRYDLTCPFSDQDEVLWRFLCKVLPDNMLGCVCSRTVAIVVTVTNVNDQLGLGLFKGNVGWKIVKAIQRINKNADVA